MKYNKIYVHTPDHYETGGVEALFQLVDAINNMGGNAIALFDRPDNYPVPLKYQHYNVPYIHTSMYEDREENLVIVPEVWTERLDSIRNARKSIWWLSVDNNQAKFQNFSDSNIFHFYQSHYALNYLTSNNAICCLPLFDYLNIGEDLSYDYTQKEDLICFNPAKGYDFTARLINQNPSMKFVALINMNRSQLTETLKRSKIYIDFGNHPGKDRIPREAAILGNCVITNNRGSARFYNDITIPLKYKQEELDEVSLLLSNSLKDYTDIIDDFYLYRRIIVEQKNEFMMQVRQFLV